MTTLFGIANCDTVKKARRWLDEHSVAYDFHDYKKAGADPKTVRRWVEEKGWEAVLNRRGTTFRKLPDEQTAGLNAEKAIELMVAHPSAIKRPIVEHESGLIVGFDPAEWTETLD